MTEQRYCKRLIEVDLPIKRISEHARREKSIRYGHISTLHIWWARRPLASCRAVICAALWLDPADPLCPEKFKKEAARLMKDFRDLRGGKPRDWKDPLALRESLLDFIADFANWDNSTVKDFIEISRALTQVAHEALGGAPGTRPIVADPFAGGGAIPLEAMRVGADAFASDLNPIPVLLNKVVLEYIPKYGQSLASEVRKWGEWIKHEAEKELIDFYPKDADGATPIAYIWARTIQCEGPSCGIELPLIGLPWLCKKGKRKVALKVIPNLKDKRIDFELFSPKSESDLPPPISKRFSATCPICGFTTAYANVREQVRKKNGGARDGRLMAVILRKTDGSRHYRLPSEKDFKAIEAAKRSLDRLLSQDSQGAISEPFPTWYSGVFNPGVWNVSTWGGLYSQRQLFAMLSLSGILRRCVIEMTKSHEDKEFCKAVATCLSFPISNLSHYMSSVSIWAQDGMLSAFIQGSGIAMRPDFAEANPIVPGLVGGIDFSIEKTLGGLDELSKLSSPISSQSQQASATDQPLPDDSVNCLVTDPPYYAAIPYSDLSDFCYVWLKRMIGELYPTLFNSELSPKDDEAIAYYTQPDGVSRIKKDGAYFETIMEKALLDCRRTVTPDGVGVVVFAHKGTAGWEALLSALLKAGWIVTASWPIDTERAARMRANASATLASSIHLFCRPRENPDGSVRMDEIGDWRDVLRDLPRRIHEWMPRLAAEGVVGADAIFACLGPALEIFSRYSRVEKASGETVTLRGYLEQVWGAVAKEALNMIFQGAHTEGFEEDARLTAIWLWTLSTGGSDVHGGDSTDDNSEEDVDKSTTKQTGFGLEFDAARKLAQGLGAHLETLTSIVEIDGDQARLISVGERVKDLFGKNSTTASPNRKKKKENQMTLFEEFNKVEEQGWSLGDEKSAVGKTILDRLHQAMILFGAGRGDAMRRFLVEEGIGKDERFWRLAQAFSALYPSNTDEKRWVDGVLARKKSLGF